MPKSYWSGVQIAMQSALAVANTITAITKANPGVVSYSGTDPANGDFVLLNVQGMNQLDKRVVRVANVNGAANTFELEGIDTSAFNTFTSGSFQIITFGTTLSIITDVGASGGDPVFADTTTVHDTVQSRAPVSRAPMSMNMGAFWDPDDLGFKALKSASDVIGERAIKLQFTSGKIAVGMGYVSAPGFPGGSAQELVKTPLNIEMQGSPTYY